MKRTFIVVILVASAIIALRLFVGADFLYTLRTYVENSDILTLETRYTADTIMDQHRKELIGNAGRSYQEPALHFHPYLMMDVKYYDKNHKTRQGVILWSLIDGEMVINSDKWEKTRGFEDAINANASAQEFRLLNALADNKGSLARDKLQKELDLDQDHLATLIESCKQKQLVVIQGNDLMLHFEDPLFNVVPQTKLAQDLVIKPYYQGKKLSANYSRAKVERTAKAAFGNDFTIREIKEIYLPVWQIAVLNPDGSLLVTDWNALTGEKMRWSRQ